MPGRIMVEEERDNFLFKRGVEAVCVGIVLGLIVFVVALFADGPTINAVKAFRPPAIQHTKIGDATQGRFLAARAAGFVRAARRVEPKIDAGDQMAGNIHIVILHKDDLAHRTPAVGSSA